MRILFPHGDCNFCGLFEKKREQGERESKKKMNPMTDTPDIQRNSTSECLDVDRIRSRNEQKKETTTTIAFAKQSGNNDKKKKTDDDRNSTTRTDILKCYPMIKKVIDDTEGKFKVVYLSFFMSLMRLT